MGASTKAKNGRCGRILELLNTPKKRTRTAMKSENDDKEPKMKKVRRSTRVRFKPLKHWANETVDIDPKRILTMKEVKEKGDALLTTPTKQRKKLKKVKKRKKSTEIDMDLRDYVCDEWTEYENDKYYDNLNPNVWLDDSEQSDFETQYKVVSLPSNMRMNRTGNCFGG